LDFAKLELQDANEFGLFRYIHSKATGKYTVEDERELILNQPVEGLVSKIIKKAIRNTPQQEEAHNFIVRTGIHDITSLAFSNSELFILITYGNNFRVFDV